MPSIQEIATVRVAGVEPFKSFVKGVSEADAAFQEMTPDEEAALPPAAVRGLDRLRAALSAAVDAEVVRRTEVGSRPRDFSAEVHSHFAGREA